MDLILANTNTQEIYDLMNGLVAPRPLAWITSMNLAWQLDAAPFSADNYMGMDPPIVAVGVANRPGPGAIGKDTAQNIRNTGEFVINVVNEAVAQAKNITAIDFPSDVNKLKFAHLAPIHTLSRINGLVMDSVVAVDCRRRRCECDLQSYRPA